MFFRTMPKKWVILANQITVAIQLDHPAVIAMLVQPNESLFAGCLLTSKLLQQFGIYNGKYIFIFTLIFMTRNYAIITIMEKPYFIF